jgi:hypothetical protein
VDVVLTECQRVLINDNNGCLSGSLPNNVLCIEIAIGRAYDTDTLCRDRINVNDC